LVIAAAAQAASGAAPVRQNFDNYDFFALLLQAGRGAAEVSEAGIVAPHSLLVRRLPAGVV
jgi:hypothetical protein